MMTPAISTPSVIESSAGRIRIPSSAAIAAPDHAPVPGRGTATKRQSPMDS